MSRPPEHGAPRSGRTPDVPDAGEARNLRERPRGRWAIRLWIGIAVLFFAGRIAPNLVTMVSVQEIHVPLEFAAPIALPGMSAGLVGGGVIAVPISALATSTIVMVVLAHAVPIAGLIVCGIIALLSLRHVVPGEAFAAPMMRALHRLAWVAFATAAAYYVPLHLGTNMTTRDLQITAEANSGVSLVTPLVAFVLVFALLAVLDIGRQVSLAGKKAQDELEGLI